MIQAAAIADRFTGELILRETESSVQKRAPEVAQSSQMSPIRFEGPQSFARPQNEGDGSVARSLGQFLLPIAFRLPGVTLDIGEWHTPL